MGDPTRTCVACRQPRPQRSLLRLAVSRGTVAADPLARLPGRGAYVCPRRACIGEATRREAAALRRALRIKDTAITVDPQELQSVLQATAQSRRAETNVTEDKDGERPAPEPTADRRPVPRSVL